MEILAYYFVVYTFVHLMAEANREYRDSFYIIFTITFTDWNFVELCRHNNALDGTIGGISVSVSAVF